MAGNPQAYRKPDVPMFVTTDPKKLYAESFAGLPEEMGDVRGTRIPSLINVDMSLLELKVGCEYTDGSVLVAAADIGNEGSDWGNLGLGVRRSFDKGNTWGKINTVIRPQAHHAPQSVDDWYSPFIIDPLFIQNDKDGSLIVIVDMFPESKGGGALHWLDEENGFTEIGGELYFTLYDGDSKIGKPEGTPNNAGNRYTVRENGWVYDNNNIKTRYYMPQYHDPKNSFMTIGDLYYAVGDQPCYYDENSLPPLVPTEPNDKQDIYVGNVLMSLDKPKFNHDNPTFVQKRRAGPGGKQNGYDVGSDYPIIETDPAPLRAAVTMFLIALRSFDGGESWSQPYFISSQVKRLEDGGFLGVGPGVGICLKNQPTDGDFNKNGRLIVPLYNLLDRPLRAISIYSDDSGITWHRSHDNGYMGNHDEVQCAELHDGTIVALGRTDADWVHHNAPTPLSVSRDGGESWISMGNTELLAPRCQKSIISYPFCKENSEGNPFNYCGLMKPGRDYVICSHPTGTSKYQGSARSDGTISLGEVQEDYSIRWVAQRKIAIEGQYDAATEDKWRNFFAYSCMAVLDDGSIGLLYEPQPRNYIAYARFNLEWLLEKGE